MFFSPLTKVFWKGEVRRRMRQSPAGGEAYIDPLTPCDEASNHSGGRVSTRSVPAWTCATPKKAFSETQPRPLRQRGSRPANKKSNNLFSRTMSAPRKRSQKHYPLRQRVRAAATQKVKRATRPRSHFINNHSDQRERVLVIAR